MTPLPGAGARLRERLLATAVARQLAPHETPRGLLVLSALPTTASGKIDRSEVSRLLQDELAGAAHARQALR